MRARRSTFAPSAALLPPAGLLLFLLAAGAPPSGADPREIAGAPPSGAARSEALPAAPSRGSVVGDSVTVPADFARAADLAPTSDPPWNPPAPIAAAEGWEYALRAPGFVVSLPFRALSLAVRGGLAFVEANDVVPRVAAILARSTRIGFLAVPASLGDRTGLGVEASLRPPPLRVLALSASASTSGYNRERAALAYEGSGIAYESGWRPREPYFGPGPDSRKSEASAYASFRESVILTLAPPWWNRPAVRSSPPLLDDPVSSEGLPSRIRPELSVWVGQIRERLLDGRDPGRPSAAARFPSLAAEMGGAGAGYFVAGARLGLDARLGHPHWDRGGRLAVEVDRHENLAGRDPDLLGGDADAPAYTRVTVDGETGWSFYRDPHTLRLAFRLEDRRPDGDSLLRVSDLARLGGSEGLAGFEPGRFADNDLAVARLSYIFPLARYLELDAHAESGAVFARPEDARLSRLRQSYGVALRVRNMFAPLGSVGLDWSAESVRFRFALGGVE